jgi:hypothetical protein
MNFIVIVGALHVGFRNTVPPRRQREHTHQSKNVFAVVDWYHALIFIYTAIYVPFFMLMQSMCRGSNGADEI